MINIVYLVGQIFGQSLSVAIYAMMMACILPFVFAITAKVLGGFKDADNANPRAFLAQTTGKASYANAVQANSFESLPMFLSAVLLAIYCFVPQVVINGLAWLYVFIRIGFGICYIYNIALLRSILWVLSMACIFMLFAMSLKMLGGS